MQRTKRGDRLSDYFGGSDGPSPIKKVPARKKRGITKFDPDIHTVDYDSSGADEEAFMSAVILSPAKQPSTQIDTPVISTPRAIKPKDYEVVVDYDSDGTAFAFSPIKFTPAAVQRRVKTPAPKRGQVAWDSTKRAVVNVSAIKPKASAPASPQRPKETPHARSIATSTATPSVVADPCSPQRIVLATHLGLDATEDTIDVDESTLSSPEPVRRTLYARPRGPGVMHAPTRRPPSATHAIQGVHLTRSVSGQRPLDSLETLPLPAACLPKPPAPRRQTRPRPPRQQPTRPRSPKFALDALKASRAQAARDAARQGSLQALAQQANLYATHVLAGLSPPRAASTPMASSKKRRRSEDQDEDEAQQDRMKAMASEESTTRQGSGERAIKRLKSRPSRVLAPIQPPLAMSSRRSMSGLAARPGRLMAPLIALSPAKKRMSLPAHKAPLLPQTQVLAQAPVESTPLQGRVRAGPLSAEGMAHLRANQFNAAFSSVQQQRDVQPSWRSATKENTTPGGKVAAERTTAAMMQQPGDFGVSVLDERVQARQALREAGLAAVQSWASAGKQETNKPLIS